MFWTKNNRYAALFALVLAVGCSTENNADPNNAEGSATPPNYATDHTADERIRVLVMDPLSRKLGCACVPGHGQRDYRHLGFHIAKTMNADVELFYAESISGGYRKTNGKPIDVIVGPRGIVLADSKDEALPTIAAGTLTNPFGDENTRGLFVVATESSFQSISDLSGKRIAIGPQDIPETHRLAKSFLRNHSIFVPSSIQNYDSVESAVFEILDGNTDATFVPEYLLPILEGCGKIKKDSLKVLGKTADTLFIQAFIVESTQHDQAKLKQSIHSMEPSIEAMESSDGFQPIVGWNQWRGQQRAGYSDRLPGPDSELREIWTASVTGPPMAGVTATPNFVFVADKDHQLTKDIFRCFDAKTGKQVWQVTVDSALQIDYTNAPRATPLAFGDQVCFLGVAGNLHCFDINDGKLIWEKNLVEDFDGRLPTWGYSTPPFHFEDKLIINPGGEKASIVALQWDSGETVWEAAGHAPAYSSFVSARSESENLVIGFDVAGLGGWNLETGDQKWHVIPKGKNDFNVPTPLIWGEQVFVTTENNASRLYDLGQLETNSNLPLAANDDLAPDTCSAVEVDGLVFASGYGELFCLSRDDQLKTQWQLLDDMFYDHTNLIAGDENVLVWNSSGDLLLIAADKNEFTPLKHWRPFGDNAKSMSHPAIVGHRIYLRDEDELKCFEF